jgi:hypothetical protein
MYEEELGSTGSWSMAVFQILFEGRIGQPSIAGDDSADAKSTGEQTMNNETRAKQHTTALTTDLP